MSDVHVNISSDKSRNQVVFNNPGAHLLPSGTGVAISQNKNAAGKVISTSGTINGVVHVNPA
jgi:hypothetical protein